MSSTYKEEIESKLKKVGEYVERLSESLERRFKNKIELWLVQAENIFDFHKLLQPMITTEELINDPMTDLESLMVFENVSSTLMPSIKNQYLSLLYRIHELRNDFMELHQDKIIQSEQILHHVLTQKKLYSGLEDLLEFMLKVIVRSYNECIIEGMCNVLQNHDNIYRPLSHETAKAEAFIAKIVLLW